MSPYIGSDLPRLDDLSQMVSLKQTARGILKQPENRAAIEEVAHRLIASSFYYEREGLVNGRLDGTCSCIGVYYLRIRSNWPADIDTESNRTNLLQV